MKSQSKNNSYIGLDVGNTVSGHYAYKTRAFRQGNPLARVYAGECGVATNMYVSSSSKLFQFVVTGIHERQIA